MLVMSRYIGEIVRIGHDIKVIVLEIRGDRVRLRIIAPLDVKIWRAEIYDAADTTNPMVTPIFPQAAKVGSLILTRKIGEVIKIGGGIEVMVVAVRGDRVRLGFTAPKDVSIHRQEVYEAIKAANSERQEHTEPRIANRKQPGERLPSSLLFFKRALTMFLSFWTTTPAVKPE